MILNFHISSIDTKAYGTPEERRAHTHINIANEINISNPHVISGDAPILRVEWSLSVNYLNPSIGYIRFKGTMNCHYKEPEQYVDNLTVDIRNEISNAILLNLASYMLDTAKLHELPPPIPIPKIDFGQVKKDNGIGYHG